MLVGGLVAVGFGAAESHIMAISFSGRSVFDCETGEKVARDYDGDIFEWMNNQTLTAEGIGPLEGERVRVVGIWGGGLPNTTDDHWSVQSHGSTGGNVAVFLEPPESPQVGLVEPILYKLYEWDPLIAYGFTSSGRTFVISCSNRLDIWTRDR